ncbi:hypothetical protein EKI60_05450 [Candidatus Saccharibacteria bacterium]|nr:MAG: hypothetical protein EKI60_05450 [Candidatus Saccharibacteria bacterium]
MPYEVESMAARKFDSRWFSEVAALKFKYYGAVLEGVPETEIGEFVGSTTLESLQNPNRAAGASRFVRGQQGFARANVAMTGRHTSDTPGFHVWRLTGFMQTADNASSRFGGVPGAIEQAAKLYLPVEQLRDRRYFVIRELVTDPSVNVLGTLVEHAVGIADERAQTANAYVFSSEKDAITALSAADFNFVPDFRADPAFESATTGPIYLDMYTRTPQ